MYNNIQKKREAMLIRVSIICGIAIFLIILAVRLSYSMPIEMAVEPLTYDIIIESATPGIDMYTGITEDNNEGIPQVFLMLMIGIMFLIIPSIADYRIFTLKRSVRKRIIYDEIAYFKRDNHSNPQLMAFIAKKWGIEVPWSLYREMHTSKKATKLVLKLIAVKERAMSNSVRVIQAIPVIN